MLLPRQLAFYGTNTGTLQRLLRLKWNNRKFKHVVFHLQKLRSSFATAHNLKRICKIQHGKVGYKLQLYTYRKESSALRNSFIWALCLLK